MWALLIGGIGIVLTIVFSLAKTSSRGEEMTKNHRQELMERKNNRSSKEEENAVSRKKIK